MLEVWDELSRILPDHTFLTESRIADGKVTLSGFSADAARLVRIIDQSPLFSGAALTAAITPDANEHKDRFSISFKVRGGTSGLQAPGVPPDDRGDGQKIPRGAPFLAFNVLVVLFVVIFLAGAGPRPFCQSQRGDIRKAAAQLAHFRKIMRSAGTLANKPSQGGDPFLPGSEERVVSADLQASLKAIAANAGVNLLGIRGLPGGRSQQLRMVAVSVELEGSLAAVRDMILAIESQTPFLFVTSASFRSVNDGEEGPIRAELKVQGAMRESQDVGRHRGGLEMSGRRLISGLTEAWSLALPAATRDRLAGVAGSPRRVAASWIAALLGRTELPRLDEIAALRPDRVLLAGLSGWIVLVARVTRTEGTVFSA